MSEEFDLIAWIHQEMDKLYAEEAAARWEELLFGPRLAKMSEAMRNAQEGFRGIAKAFEGFSSVHTSVWRYDEHIQEFTPAEFNKLWDGFTEQRKIEYVMSLIS